MFQKIAKFYQNLIEYFVPAHLKNDRDASNQARMFLISHTIGPIVGNSVPLALYLFDPTPGMDTFWLSVSITAFWVFPFLLRAGVRYDLLVITSVINLNFCIFWSCYYNGGVVSPTLPWILTIPILSFFYIGGESRLQAALLTIFGLSFAGFLAAYTAFDPPLNDIPEIPMQALGIVSTVAALCYVATMAIFYSRIFDAGVELENEVRRRVKATEELRNAVKAADRAGNMKAEFLARMSHELRTPLNAVIGYSQLLKEEAMDTGGPQMVEDVDRIHDAGQYLLRLINMILDLSKIEAGRMQFDNKVQPLATIVHRAIDNVREAAKQNGNAIEIHIGPEIGDIEIDEVRLTQIADAILQNAAEHTKNGLIEVRCDLLADIGASGSYAISIRDTGSGIPPERLATLFETLTDTRDASASKYGGTGLNLTVTDRLCRAMGGEIHVESMVGAGSLFTIVVPRRPQDRAAAADARPAAIAA